MILEGQVTLNGKIIDKLGIKADPDKDHIKINNKLLLPKHRGSYQYILLYKPKGVITTCDDPFSRTTILDLIKKKTNLPLKPVGRLDFNTEGLIILTNDGDMINMLTHPKYNIEKTYIVKVKGMPSEKSIALLRNGIRLGAKKTMPAKIKSLETTDTNAWFEVIISEGQNQQVRKMFDAIGHSVLKLKRTEYAFLNLKGVEKGAYRFLGSDEVDKLKKLCTVSEGGQKLRVEEAWKRRSGEAEKQKGLGAKRMRNEKDKKRRDYSGSSTFKGQKKKTFR